MTEMVDPLPPLTRLILAYVPVGRRDRDRLIWTLDARLADVVRSTREPMIGQMRIAWWDEALSDGAGVKGRGEPLLEAIRAAGLADSAPLRSLLDGWEALLIDPLDDVTLNSYAAGRGEGLFMALADIPAPPPWLAATGRLWAYWDLSAHVGDAAVRQRAVALAQRELPALAEASWPREWKALRLLAGLARHDIMRGQAGAAGLTPRLYMRLLRLSVTGG